MCKSEAGEIFSIAAGMELAAFKMVVFIDVSFFVDPCSFLLSMTSILESRNVITHSFNSFEMHKLKWWDGSKVEMQYKPDSDISSIKFASSGNDFHAAKDHWFNVSSIWSFTAISSSGYSSYRKLIYEAYEFFKRFCPSIFSIAVLIRPVFQILIAIQRDKKCYTKPLHPSNMTDERLVFHLCYVTAVYYNRGCARIRYVILLCMRKDTRCAGVKRLQHALLRLVKHLRFLELTWASVFSKTKDLTSTQELEMNPWLDVTSSQKCASDYLQGQLVEAISRCVRGLWPSYVN